MSEAAIVEAGNAHEDESEESKNKHGIPSQPVVNIGTSGHVDHGKCLTADQYVLLGNSLVQGSDIIESLKTKGRLLETINGESVYALEGNSVFGLDESFQVVESDSLFFTQQYSGTVYTVYGKSGRKISVTPEHPLLVNRNGNISWIKAKEIQAGRDCIAFASKIPQISSSRFVDPFIQLGTDYWIVSFEDYERIVKSTEDFMSLEALDASDLNKVRILARVSFQSLASISHIDYVTVKEFMRGTGSLRESQKQRVIQALESKGNFENLACGEYLLEAKSNSRIVSKIRDVQIDIDIAKWFAFVWSEGSSSDGRVAVAQTIQMSMLEKFLKISQWRFGQRFRKVSTVDYHLDNKAFVDYLRAKFSFTPSNEAKCSISDWVLGLPVELKAAFLRWFFTLDGGFNPLSGQIELSQANERNIVIIGYMLQMFGIVPRFSIKKAFTRLGIKKYYRLSISGRANLRIFLQDIGFEDVRITKKVESYLSKLKEQTKESDFSVPVSHETLRLLLDVSGISRESFGKIENAPSVKTQNWYKAYEANARTNMISKDKLLSLLTYVEGHLAKIEQASEQENLPGLLDLMSRSRIGREELATQLGISRKKLVNLIRRNTKSEELSAIRLVVSSRIDQKIRQAKVITEQLKQILRSAISFDHVNKIDIGNYVGPIFDLAVPSHANFIAGYGAVVCHNTTLTQAITGIWTSAHSEELRRGITIKVGYADAAFYRCSGCSPPDCYTTSPDCGKCGGVATLLRVVSFVDCPGHESLMANMLSGAAVMDGSVLVIAANEKVPQPQTREHLLALQMLGMKHIVIAQNKVDLVTDAEAQENLSLIRKFVAGSVAAEAPIIPISAQHHLNIDALIEAIEENIPTPQRKEDAPPLMQVLRSFDVNHPGLVSSKLSGGVLGGTLLQGSFSLGDEIEVRPGIIEEGSAKAEPIHTKITTLMSSAGNAQKVHPGGLIAVGTQLDPFYTRSDSLVGSVIGKPDELPPVFESLSMEARLFETAVGTQELVKVDKIKMQEVLRLNIGTGVTVGIVSSSRDHLVDVKLRKPVCASKGDRIAISRRIGDRWRLIGAGTVR